MTQKANRLPAKRAVGFLVLLAIVSSVVWAGQQSSDEKMKAARKRDAEWHFEFVNFHEDWNTLTLDNSNLQAQQPVMGVKYEVPGKSVTRELHQLSWRPGDPLDLYIVRPAGVKKPPVIIYLYSFPQDINRFTDDKWAVSATAGGRFAAVGFVSGLTGARADYRPPNEWFVSEFQESLATSVHDVQMILNYLATKGDFDMDRVGMFGQGSGATIAILASAADPRIEAVDALGPWGDWPDWMAKTTVVPDSERAKYNTPEFLSRVAHLDPVVWLPKIKAKNFRLEDVRQDTAVPDVAEEKMEAAAPPFAEIDQFGDRTALFPVAAGGKLFTWLQDKLEPGTTPVQAADKSERIHFYPSKVTPKSEVKENPLPMSSSTKN